MSEIQDPTGTKPDANESVLEDRVGTELIDTNIGENTHIEPPSVRISTIIDEIEYEIGELKRNSKEMDPLMFQGEWPLAVRSIGQKIRAAMKAGFSKDEVKMHMEELAEFMKGVDKSGAFGHQIFVLKDSLPKPEKGLSR